MSSLFLHTSGSRCHVSVSAAAPSSLKPSVVLRRWISQMQSATSPLNHTQRTFAGIAFKIWETNFGFVARIKMLSWGKYDAIAGIASPFGGTRSFGETELTFSSWYWYSQLKEAYFSTSTTKLKEKSHHISASITHQMHTLLKYLVGG